MGCGSSTANSGSPYIKHETLADTVSNEQDETEENDEWMDLCPGYINVDLSKPNYPAPRPPLTRKVDCFKSDQMHNIDAKAQQTPDSYADSFETLLEYLSEDCKTELEKLRSIFSWFGAQNISKAIYRHAEVHTPKGFLNLLRLKAANYASFFAKLCRSAGLPCVIVLGLGKTCAYEVGDTDLGDRCSWNAVHVDGAWRIINPNWAFTGIVGYNSGNWALLETDGKQVNERQEAAEGVTVQTVDEFHFMTDPDHFIICGFADDPEWQLLAKPWTIEQFESVPYFGNNYFIVGLQLLSTYNCHLASKLGVCEIEFDVPKVFVLTGYELTYNLYGEDDALSSILEEGVHLANYVFLNRIGNRFIFEIRFPLEGTYKIVIHGSTGDVCEFLLECGVAQKNCKPLPILPAIGWGPGYETKKMGLEATTHKSGSVPIKKDEIVKIRFHNSNGLEIRTVMIHRTIAQKLLQSCVAQKINKKEVELTIRVPEDDEFALQLFAKNAESNDEFKNFCNYLLRPNDNNNGMEMKEDTQSRNMRKLLKMQMEQGNISKLEYIINQFEERHIDDRGDITAAKDRLQFLILQKALRDAIMARNLVMLEKAVNDANRSSHKETLESWIEKAEFEIEALKKLIRLRHAILEMKQATISEIRSYQRPPLAVKHVMVATFTILGEKQKKIQSWKKVQALIGKIGKSSLQRKVKTFDMSNASVMIAADAHEYIKEYDVDSVREVSCGAATFYVWNHVCTSTFDPIVYRP